MYTCTFVQAHTGLMHEYVINTHYHTHTHTHTHTHIDIHPHTSAHNGMVKSSHFGKTLEGRNEDDDEQDHDDDDDDDTRRLVEAVRLYACMMYAM